MAQSSTMEHELEQQQSAKRDRLIDALVTEALDVLHHDRTEGSEVDQYERRQLRTRFGAVLYGHS